MTDQQKRAAAGLSLAIVLAVAVFHIWLMGSILGSAGPLGNRWPGRQFMLTIANWSVLGIALKALPLLITIGIGIVARYKLRDWLFYGIVAASVLGIVAAAYLLIEVSSIDTARRFWAYSPLAQLEDYNSFVAAAQAGLGVMVAWLLGILYLQLGVKPGENR